MMIFSHDRQQYATTDAPENTPPPQAKVMEELLSEGSAATLRFFFVQITPSRHCIYPVSSSPSQ